MTLPSEGALLRIDIGVGARSRVHTAKSLELSTDLPVVVELVDSVEKIEAFLSLVDDAIKDGLATVERVQIRFYGSSLGAGAR